MESCIFCRIVAGSSPDRRRSASGKRRLQGCRGHGLHGYSARDRGPHPAHPAGAPAERRRPEPRHDRHLFGIARRITQALYDGLGCAGVNWFVADGEAAGQEVFHLHLHLIPRNPGDGFGLHFPPDYRQLPERKALDCAAHTISGALADTPPATND